MATELIIGYGSLMSITGIDGRNSTRGIPINDAFIVRLPGKRGFNKPPRFMDIEWRDIDLSKGHITSKTEEPIQDGGHMECLAIEIPTAHFNKINIRERLGKIGENLYNKRSEIIEEGNTCLAEYLWKIYERSKGQGHNKILDYRERLIRDRFIGAPKSDAYVPHPVRLDDGRFGVISIHQDWGLKKYRENFVPAICDLVNRHGKTVREIKSYFQWCVLGGAHGIYVKDLLECLNNPENFHLKNGLLRGMNINDEVRGFKKRVKINYEERFGTEEERLKRSGLMEFYEVIMKPIHEETLAMEVHMSPRELDDFEKQGKRVAVVSKRLANQRIHLKIGLKEISIDDSFSIKDPKLELYCSRQSQISKDVSIEEAILLNRNVRDTLKVSVGSKVSVITLK